MSDLDNVVQEFLVESYENLDQLDRDFVVLEGNPTDREKLGSIFRTIHTIKGTCGFLGFSKLETVAHAGENLLGRLRDGQLLLNSEITSALLAMVDAVRQLLGNIEKKNEEGDGDYAALIATLNALQAGGGAAAPPASVAAAVAAEASQPGQQFGPASPAEPAAFASTPAEQEGNLCPASEKSAAAAVGNSEKVPGAPNPPAGLHTTAVADSSIRVDVGVLDRLMNLVGELVLARNQILQYNTARQDAVDTSFAYTTQRLNLITTELQEGVMKTRMQPIKNIWQKFPRVVRDLAIGCGKRVRIEMEGEDTELDKTLIETIKDPLTHLVRNSVDHGIERPEVRVAKGKPAEGRLLLRAYHEGGQVNIEISDDGGGISLEAIKQKALQRGLITAAQAARISEREQLNLIFLPGLSTAEKITNVSGRGVGMDVVKTNVEKIGGTIDVHSTPGQGTTVKMKIPLTLAIIPALIVTCGGDRYAIPQVSLLELVRLEGEEAQKGVEMIHSTPVYRLRGKLLPMVHLGRELGIAGPGSLMEQLGSEAVNIVVLQAEDRQFGLLVDAIQDTEEIVVKPLGKQFKGISAYAGATIMGDGKVSLILDVLGLAQGAGVVSEASERALENESSENSKDSANRQMLLICEVRSGGRMAIPLSLVARLEEFPRSSLERAGSQDVVQYRSAIMPLLFLSHYLPGAATGTAQAADPLQVVVYSEQARSVGLVVEHILDIVEESLVLQREGQCEGVLGSAVVQGRVTDLLDVRGIVRKMDPNFLAQPAAAGAIA